MTSHHTWCPLNTDNACTDECPWRPTGACAINIIADALTVLARAAMVKATAEDAEAVAYSAQDCGNYHMVVTCLIRDLRAAISKAKGESE